MLSNFFKKCYAVLIEETLSWACLKFWLNPKNYNRTLSLNDAWIEAKLEDNLEKIGNYSKKHPLSSPYQSSKERMNVNQNAHLPIPTIEVLTVFFLLKTFKKYCLRRWKYFFLQWKIGCCHLRRFIADAVKNTFNAYNQYILSRLPHSPGRSVSAL